MLIMEHFQLNRSDNSSLVPLTTFRHLPVFKSLMYYFQMNPLKYNSCLVALVFLKESYISKITFSMIVLTAFLFLKLKLYKS